MMSKKIFSFAICLISLSVVKPSHWNYKDVNAWGHISRGCSLGRRQSPINLVTVVGMISSPNNPAVQLYNYQERSETVFRNNGHTVELIPNYKKSRPLMTGTSFGTEVYALQSAHLHWGTDNKLGTEHSINGIKYAAELHLVHYNTKYGSFEKAAKQLNGLAVASVIYSVDDSSFPSPSALFLDHLLSNYSVNYPGHQTTLTNFQMEHIQPKLRRMFTYEGSLTTPPCSENVRWIVQADLEIMPSRVMSNLRKITLDDATPNIRPLQNLNGRPVHYTMIYPFP